MKSTNYSYSFVLHNFYSFTNVDQPFCPFQFFFLIFLKLVIDTSDYSFSKVCFSFCWFLRDFYLCDDSVLPFHFFPKI